MSKPWPGLVICFSIASSAEAHEFWLEPTGIDNQTQERSLNAQVFIGENFKGKVYPFEPRAYAAAYWIGPKKAEALHRLQLSDRDLALDFQGDGLHTLAVASYGTGLVHDTVDDFLAFAREVGAESLVAKDRPIPDENGGVPETYRRFSKLLVQYGHADAADMRHGFEYEWVKSPFGLQLFATDHVAKHHPVDLFCRSFDAKVTYERHVTDAEGQLPFVSGEFDRCLVNAVFLRSSRSGREWSSTWVSLTWDP
ncbi:MAG: hypothetical protein AAGF36_06090 [Pseudomonadota bacterium]